jgi:hypothetical protein
MKCILYKIPNREAIQIMYLAQYSMEISSILQ